MLFAENDDGPGSFSFVYTSDYYTVTWDANGAELSEWDAVGLKQLDMQYPAGLLLTGEEYTPFLYNENKDEPKYVFKGWALTKDAQQPSFSASAPLTVNKNMTIYAVIKERYYDADPLQEDTAYKIDLSLQAEEYHLKFIPTADGVYHFRSADRSDEKIDPNITLYNSFGDNIEYNDNAGTPDFDLSYRLNGGETYYLVVKVKPDDVGGTFTVTASTDSYCNITWDANGGMFDDLTDPERTTVRVGVGARIGSYSAAEPIKDGCRFIGWALSADAQEDAFDTAEPYTVTEDTTFYAVYEELGEVRTVSAVNVKRGIKITWQSATEMNSYAVERREGSGEWVQLTVSTGTTYTDKKCKGGHKYRYRVKGLDADGNVSGTCFDPKGTCLREHIVTFIYRYKQKF